MKALELQLQYELVNQKITYLKSVFIGGGTPSCVDAKYYVPIIELLSDYIDENTEFTTEANPNSATFKWQKEMFEIGINRISFGVQSFNENKLNFLARNHSKNDAIDAIKNAHSIGFKHINCDIIYDTILDTNELINDDLEIISTLNIDHISAYSLTLEEGTKFYNKTNIKVDDENMARYIFENLKNQGFNQYEISNFSKDVKSRCKHNIGYWEYDNYLGIGCGAVGCLENKRTYTNTDVEKYINNYKEYENIEILSKNDILVEKTLLGLRCVVGCDFKLYNTKQLKIIDILVENKKIFIKNNRFYANDYMLADELALYILEDKVG
jgi:oxygen-independent coproporphyrinogen-3 oxidase